jgi:hypothetical protein
MNPLMLVGPAMSAAGSMKAGKAADAAGKYKQQVAERNAKVVEQEKLIKHHQTGEDIIRFREKFRAVQGGTAMSLAKAGVRSDTGTGLRIMMENARLADEDIAAALVNAPWMKKQRRCVCREKCMRSKADHRSPPIK